MTVVEAFLALDATRLADLSATTGYGLWRGDGIAPFRSWQAALLNVAADRPAYRIHGRRPCLASSPVGAGPINEAYGRLQALAAHVPKDLRLIHSDLLRFNVLVDAGADSGRITGVLDRGCAMYGDFLYDLAWLCFWQPWYPAWQRNHFRTEADRHYAAIASMCPASRSGCVAARSTAGRPGLSGLERPAERRPHTMEIATA